MLTVLTTFLFNRLNKILLSKKTVNAALTRKMNPARGGGGGGVLGLTFARYVPLASQSPYPIIVYFWSTLRPIINPILVTFGQMIFLLSKSRKRATPF